MPAAICIIASVMMKEGMPITVSPKALTRPSRAHSASASRIAAHARHRDVGDVDVGVLQREVGDRDAGDVGDAGDREVDLGAQDHEGEADGDDAGDRDLRQDVAEIVERRKGGAGGGEEAEQADQRQERRDVAHLGAQHRGEPARPFAIRGDCHAFT